MEMGEYAKLPANERTNGRAQREPPHPGQNTSRVSKTYILAAVSFGLLFIVQSALNVSLWLQAAECSTQSNNASTNHFTKMSAVDIEALILEKDRLVQENDQLVQEKDQLVQEKDQLVQDKMQLVQEKDLLVQEKDQRIQDTKQLVQEKKQLVQEKDQLVQDTKQLVEEKDQLVQEKDQLVQDKKQLVQEKDQLVEEKDQLVQDKKQLVQEKDQLVQENNQLVQEKDQLVQEKDQLVQDKKQLVQENNQLVQEKDQLVQDKKQLVQEKDQLVQEKDQLVQDKKQLVQDKKQLVQENNQLVQEKDQLVQENNQLVQEKDQLVQEKKQLFQDKKQLVQERDQLVHDKNQLRRERNQLGHEKEHLIQERDKLVKENKEQTANNTNLFNENTRLGQIVTQLQNQIQSEQNIPCCPSGWQRHKSSCYQLSSRENTWQHAKEDCESKGSHLVLLNDEAEEKVLRGFGGDAKLWMGLSGNLNKQTNRWYLKTVDSSPRCYANWKVIPSLGNNTYCAYVDYDPSYLKTWFLVSCEEQHKWMCEKKPASICQQNIPCCPSGWQSHKSSCYQLSSSENTWQHAKEDCESKGSHLVVLNDEAEEKDVRGFGGDAKRWIGLSANPNRQTNHWELKTVDPIGLCYGNWKDPTPNVASNIYCAYVDYHTLSLNNWFRVSCQEQHKWMCEKKNVSIFRK